MYESVEDMPEDLQEQAPEGRENLLLEMVNTGGESADTAHLLDATSIDLGEEDTIVVHGHKKGSTIRHKTGTFEVDDWFIQELKEGFNQITQQGYRPPLLKQHKPDPKGRKSGTRDPKGPRPIEDGFNYGRIVEVVEAPSERAQELEEEHENVPEKDGVWFVAEVPGAVKQAHQAGFIQHWSPGLYRNWTPPHPSMGENVPLAPRHLAFVSVPHQKNLDTTTPQYDLEEKMVEADVSVDLGETHSLQLMSLSEGVAINLAATEHQDWPIASLEREWDSSAAHSRLVDYFGADEEDGSIDEGFFQAHLFYPEEDRREGNISAGKLPVVDIVDGEPHYIPRAARAADQALSGARGGVELPDQAESDVRERLDRIYSEISDEFPEDWPETPSILRNENSEETLMSEEYDELKEDLEGIGAELKELKESLASDEEEEAEEPEELVELREQKEKLEDKVEDLERKRLRDNLEARGVDLEEMDEGVDDLLELSQTDPVEYTAKVTKAVGGGADETSSETASTDDEEVGGTGNPPQSKDREEEFEEAVVELEEEEGMDPASQEFMDELAERGFEDMITQ